LEDSVKSDIGVDIRSRYVILEELCPLPPRNFFWVLSSENGIFWCMHNACNVTMLW